MFDDSPRLPDIPRHSDLGSTTRPSPAPRSLTRRHAVLGAGLATATMTVARFTVTDAAAAPVRHRGRRHRGTDRPMPRLTMTADGMVQRRGATFRTGGINAFQLVTNDYPAPRLMTHVEIDSLLYDAVAMKVGVVRAHTLGASVGQPLTLVSGVSGSGPNPTIIYNQDVWDVIDYAVWKARRLGIYLIAPLVDELGYYHGGKRHWVNFRYPGSVSLDSSVTAASSSRQRAAEGAFYSDQQVTWDFEQYVRDWLEHVNPLTGRAFKDEPVLSVVQVGNELWTAAQDAPGWVAAKAALIKSVAPRTLVMDSGADGLAIEDMAWSSPHVDILETHPYDVFGASDVTLMARFAASKGKAFAVGEYPWSKPAAPAIEAAVRRVGNIFTSAPWSLHNEGDLHNAAASYGDDDLALHLRAEDDARRAAIARVIAHDRAMIRSAADARPPRSGRRAQSGSNGVAGGLGEVHGAVGPLQQLLGRLAVHG